MSDSVAVNVALTLLIVVLMVPGLIVEPGPISRFIESEAKREQSAG